MRVDNPLRGALWGLLISGVLCLGCSKQAAVQEASSQEPNAAPTSVPSSRADAPELQAAPAEPAGLTLEDTNELQTEAGVVKMIPVYHGTLVLEFAGQRIWIDPWAKGDLTLAPKGDYVFITDIHPDHLDPAAIERVKKEGAILVGPAAVAKQLPGLEVLNNGDKKQFGKFSVEATPMYNLKRGPEPGKLYHDRGRGNGYLFTFGDKRVYVSGDTACTPEMCALQNIDVAFVCMNLPYTMTPDEAASCVTAFQPKVVYPYHYRGSDLSKFTREMAAASIPVRLRSWY